MSLCVAWKYEDRSGSRVYFASDSCVVVGKKVMPYGGIKVLKVPVCITSAVDAKTERAEDFLRVNYGMAFVGVYFSAFLLKELISEVLSHLQFPGSREAVSFELICQLVARFHTHFYNQIRDYGLPAHEALDFFLGGYCPQSRRIRVAKFMVDRKEGQSRPVEILQGAGFHYETIGVEDGQKRFHTLMDLNLSAPHCRTHFAAFRRLWDVIRDKEIRCVKGAVQYGSFEGDSFELVGAFSIAREGESLKPRTFVRGTDMEQVHNPLGLGELHVGYSYGNPFEEDIQNFDTTRAFWSVDGKTHHVVDEQITILPNDARWSEWFKNECEFLRMEGIPDALTIEHVGSTAVPGVAAIPCVDMVVGVNALPEVQRSPFNIEQHGYEYLGDRLIAGQRCYRKRGDRWFNLHVVQHGGDFWNQAISLRDYLRGHPDEAEAFGREKVRILNQGSWTLVRYLNKRANYLNQLLARAGL
jgi:GrpB-like predicted nucleotidyltransferase (UPF0157 family)